MNAEKIIDRIEAHFSAYLDKGWSSSNLTPFRRTYIRLLLVFGSELSAMERDALVERQKQLRGEDFQKDRLEEVRIAGQKRMSEYSRTNTRRCRAAILDMLLVGALLDSRETDVFYLTEPLFEFVHGLQVSPEQLVEILESEFEGFMVPSIYAPSGDGPGSSAPTT